MWLLEDVSRVTNHDSNIPAKTLSLSVHSACSREGMSFACHFNSLKSASANPREVSVGRKPLPNGWDCTAPHVIQQMKEVPTQHLPYLVSVHRIFLLQLTLSHCLVLSLIFLQFFCWHLWDTFGRHAFKDQRNTGKAFWKLCLQAGSKGNAGNCCWIQSLPVVLPPPRPLCSASHVKHLPIHCRLAEIFLRLLLFIFQILRDIAIRNKNKMEPENREEANMLWYVWFTKIKCLIKKNKKQKKTC